MGSRIREDPLSTFEVYVEVSHPGTSSSGPVLLRHFPVDFTEQETLQTVQKFCFPFSTDRETLNHGGQNFTFVLTDIESKHRFGFCRLSPSTHTCYCFLSYLPWFEVFYRLLNVLADYTVKGQDSQWHELLVTLYSLPIPEPGAPVHLGGHSPFTVPDSRRLPSVPENRNLTEYFVAVDVNNMLHLYASMLFERRILICCSKLSTLTACVHGAAAMLYPMFWQHVYIPVLPQHLLDYCCAPMPYLIGVHSSLMEKVGGMALDDAVILNVDTNTLESSYNDLQSLPNDVVSSLKSRLKKVSATTGDGVARAFLKSQASLFGSYRNALKFEAEEPITFNEETFVNHRSSAMRQFLQNAIQLQFFKQFIDGRLELLNSGRGFSDVFEEEISLGEYGGSDKTYHQWLFTVKKGGGAIFNTMRTKANPAMKTVYKFAKDHARMGLKEVKNRLKQKEEAENGFSTGGSAVISDDSGAAFNAVSSAVRREGHVDSCRPITVHFGQGWPPVLLKRPSSEACVQSGLDHSVRPTRHYTVFLSEDSSGDELHYNDESISGFPDSFLLSVPFDWSPLPQPYHSLKEAELSEGSESHTAPPSPVTDRFSNVNLLGEIFGCQDEPDSQPIALTKSLEDLRSSRNSELQSKFTYQPMDLDLLDTSQALPGLKVSSSYSRIPNPGPDRGRPGGSPAGDAHPQPVLSSITVPRPHGRRTPEPGTPLVPPLSCSKAAPDGKTLSGGQEFRLALTRNTDKDVNRPPQTSEDTKDLISLLDPLNAPAPPGSSCPPHSTDPYHRLLPVSTPPPFTLRPHMPLNPFAQSLQLYPPPGSGNPFSAVCFPGGPPPQAFSTLPGLYRPQIPPSSMVPIIRGVSQPPLPYPGSALPHPSSPKPVVCVQGPRPPPPAEMGSAVRDAGRAGDPFGDLLPLNTPATPHGQRAELLRKKWETFD